MSKPQLRVEEAKDLRYLLSVGDDSPGSQELRPVLCFLHGYDEGAPMDIRKALTQHGPLRAESSPRATRDFVVVAPQLPMRGDLWRGYADAVLGMVRGVQERYGGDPARTYLTGFSFGGNGVFDLALLQPEIWAALWAVDPTRVPARHPGRPVWLSFGEVARRGQAAFIRALGLRTVEEGLEGDCIYLDEGADHVGSATRAYRDERIYSWLLSKRLAEAER